MIGAVLDEEGLLPDAPEEFPDSIVSLMQFLRQLRSEGLDIRKRSNVWEANVATQLRLLDVAFYPGHIDEDVRQLIIQIVSALPDWDNQGEQHSSREFVAGKLSNHEVWACVVVPSKCRTEPSDGATLHFIGTVAQALAFFRDAVVIGNYSELAFIDNCKRAFPDLYLRDGIAAQIGNFTIAYNGGMRGLLLEAFSDLNDVLPELLRDIADLREVARRFNARSRFSISPESPLTHGNAAAMRLRDVVFGAATIRCEWHLKLEPHQNRIHFYFGQQNVAPGKILIGIFTEHLLN